MIHNLKKGIDSLLHPASCVLCARYHEFELPWICESCVQQLDLSFSSFVRELKLVNKEFVFPVYSCWHFDETIQNVIHALKYNKHFSIGPFLGKKIAQKEKALDLDFNDSLLVPVPLHAKRLKERGFNQSERIAQGIMKHNDEANLVSCLKRIVYTQNQAMLSREERLKNVFNAFLFDAKYEGKISGKKIYLIDDVLTTGATMTECCKALLKAGATTIIGLTIATAS